MSNEVIKDELLTGSIELLDGVQFGSQNKIYTDNEISKVLFVKSFANVLHTEILDEEVNVSGKVITSLTYISTSGESQNVDSEIEFNQTVKDKRIKQGDEVCVTSSIIDCEMNSVSVNEVDTNTIVELNVKLVSNEKINYVTGGGDGLYVLDEPFKDKFLTKSGKEEVSFEIEVQNKEDVLDVLNSSCALAVKSIKGRGGIAQVDFNACYSLFIKEEEQFKIINDETSVSEEVVIDIAGDESLICGRMNVISCDSEIQQNKVILKINATFCYDVYEEKTLNFVSDAFSTTNEIKLNVISALQNRFAYNFSENTEIVGNISVNDENFEIRKVVGALPKNLVISKFEVMDGEVEVEGVSLFSAIYQDVEDVYFTVDVEIPFVSTFKNPNIKKGQMVSISSCIFDVKAKIRKANEIEICAGANICFNLFEKNEFAYVNNIEIGEEKIADENALVVYVAKDNESLFDIAKKLSISLAELKEQNPALEDGLNNGASIVIYKQKIVN